MKKFFYKSSFLAALAMLSVNASAQFAGGTGSEEDPYLIETAAQLNEMRNYLDGNHFRLNADIDLSEWLSENSADTGWEPVGANPDAGVTGSFDGNGHIISGFYINRPELENVGLFGCVKTSGKFGVRKLGLIIADGKEVKGLNNVGGIIGQVPYTGQTIEMSECFVIGNITAVGDGDKTGVAGPIVAMTSALGNVEVVNCYTAGKVYGFAKAGGLVGQGYRGVRIETSYSTCEVEAGTNEAESKAGGLVGECGYPNGSAIRHDVIASIALNSSVKAPNSPAANVGRLVGYEKPDNPTPYMYEFAYAWAEMPVNDAVVTDGLETNKNGLNQASADVVKEDVYFGDDYLFWDPAVWTLGNGAYQLPILTAFAADKQPTDKVAHLPNGGSSSIDSVNGDGITIAFANNQITIVNKRDNSEVAVYDLTGKKVLVSYDAVINASSLHSGVYLVVVGKQVVKIVKG